jgi:hypothetical protein
LGRVSSRSGMEEGEGRVGGAGPLVDHIDRYFMDPTTYSAIR